jgi:uncharacterized membrane protein YfcA
MPALLRDLLVGIGVGAFSGALGVGGGIILVPFLVLALHIAQKHASATSLVMVAIASTAGATTYAFAQSVAWVPALWLIVGGLFGAVLGSWLVQRIADHRLQIAFGAFLGIVSVRLFLPISAGVTSAAELPAVTPPIAASFVLIGLAMGILSALFGIGGGILLIPVLVTLFDFGQQFAAGTSLAVMAPIALIGAIRQTKPGFTNWPMGLRIGAGSVLGAVVGALTALALPGEIVRWVFAVVLLLVALRMVRTGIRKPG